jgi:hypothetical protein
VVSASLAFQIAASAMTILGSWLYGSKSLWGPAISVLSQVPWWLLMVHESLWGLLPVNAMMLVIHTRNFIRWKHEQN